MPRLKTLTGVTLLPFVMAACCENESEAIMKCRWLTGTKASELYNYIQKIGQVYTFNLTFLFLFFVFCFSVVVPSLGGLNFALTRWLLGLFAKHAFKFLDILEIFKLDIG